MNASNGCSREDGWHYFEEGLLACRCGRLTSNSLPLHWAIRLRKRLLLRRDSRWNAWVRDVTAWLERS